MRIDDLAGSLLSTSEWRARGMSRTAWEAALARGDITLVHTGWFVATSLWRELYPEGRELLRVLAVDAAARDDATMFSHTSAAAVHGLPFARFAPRFTHTVSDRANGRVSAAGLVARHRALVADGDATVVQGVRCTSLARTVTDVIGALPLEGAVAIADAAMRSVAWDADRRKYDAVAAEHWRGEMLARLDDRAGQRGVVQARWVMQFADGRGQRPGESISRLYLHWLGFAAPRLQVEVRGPAGEVWRLDFGLDDIPGWGEFDGELKYLDPVMRAGRTPGEVVLDEKWREDYIRGTTGRSVYRWGDRHIATADTLAARLASFGVALPRTRARLLTQRRRSTF